MPYELTAQAELMAKHQLVEREELHSHRWRIKACIGGELHNGRVISLPQIKGWIDEIIAPLQNSSLNDNHSLDAETRREPTCENLSRFCFEKLHFALMRNGDPYKRPLEVKWVEVHVTEADGRELGGARYLPVMKP